MIVDFGDVSKSVGVYPGGQTENPADNLYADQVPFWAQGKYLPLSIVSSPMALPADAKVRAVRFIPPS